jgi:hypothetical protein
MQNPACPQRLATAHLYIPKDRSAYARSRLLLDYTAAVSLDCIEPLYLRTRVQLKLLVKAQTSVSRATALYFTSYPLLYSLRRAKVGRRFV